MASPPMLRVSSTISVAVEPFTPAAFARFGTAIIPPLPTTTTSLPDAAVPIAPLHPDHQPVLKPANQSTALKSNPVSPMTNDYAHSSNGNSRPQMSMFSCFPRDKDLLDGVKLAVKILERHPFTTQTFCPLGVAADESETYFLVIVAPSLDMTIRLSKRATSLRNPPDLAGLKAFVARGDQAVTYGPGTWHAPMVVLGKNRIDFLVTQFVNDVPEDDCQEVSIDDSVSVMLNQPGLKGGPSPKL